MEDARSSNLKSPGFLPRPSYISVDSSVQTSPPARGGLTFARTKSTSDCRGKQHHRVAQVGRVDSSVQMLLRDGRQKLEA
ncbi:hypothetical protein NL676_027603 [Syzygium grande]|nr:hypothetical protein NL676_027603 [Syzygium grande]